MFKNYIMSLSVNVRKKGAGNKVLLSAVFNEILHFSENLKNITEISLFQECVAYIYGV